MGVGDTYMYLPDGQLILAPEDPYTWSEGEYVHPAKLTHDVGQAGLFYAQRPMFQGLATTATACASASRTAIGLQTEMIDTNQGHNPSTNNANYYFPSTRNGGYPASDFYLCIGYLPLSTTDAADRFMVQLVTASTPTIRSGMMAPSGAGHNVDLMVVDVVAETGTGTGGPNVSLNAYNTTVSSINTLTSSKTASLTVRWVGCNRTYNTVTPVATPHTWTPQDEASANATGASSQPGGVKVPLNAEIAPNLQFYNSPPICRVYAFNTTQTVPTGSTWTAIQFDIVSIDNFSGFSSAHPTRYTAPRAGLYFVAGLASWTESTSTHNGYRACRLQVNGDPAKIYGGNTMVPTTGTNADVLAIHAVALIQMNAGDYVELQMQQTQSSTALSIEGDNALGARLVAVWQSL